VSKADTTIAADTFTRADGTDLGSTEIGGFTWSERQTNAVTADIAAISGGELAFTLDASVMAIVDVGASDLIASAKVHFVGSTDGAGTTKAIGMAFRGSNMNAHFVGSENVGLISIQLTNSGGLGVYDNKAISPDWAYFANPFNAGVDAQTYGAAGSLPTAINGASFDANGDGRLGSDESFQLGAFLSGTDLAVQINGQTITTVTLGETAGVTGNYFAFMRNNWGGAGNSPLGAFDDLTLSNVPEPSMIVLSAAGLLGLLPCAWRRRK
jgi:hypothetical protein